MKKISMLIFMACFLIAEEIAFEHNLYETTCKGASFNKKGLTLCYSKSNKGPLFVSYNAKDVYFKKEYLQKKFQIKPDSFINEDDQLNLEFYNENKIVYPTKLKSSKMSSYSLEEKEENSVLSVTVPMTDYAYNIWKRIEKFEAKQMKKYEDIHVISGTIYTSSKALVPEYIYKIIFAPHVSKMISFIVPQAGDPLKENINIHKYSLEVSKLEKITKINYFSKLEEDVALKIKRKNAYF